MDWNWTIINVNDKLSNEYELEQNDVDSEKRTYIYKQNMGQFNNKCYLGLEFNKIEEN